MRKVVGRVAVSLGFAPGQIVQEFYVDDDVDDALRDSIIADTGHELVDLDYGDVVDGVIIWWRAEDAEEEDLDDVLVDALSNLDDGGGVIWVLSPKAGTAGSVPVADIEDSARSCGLQCTSATKVADGWAGIRLVARGRGK